MMRDLMLAGRELAGGHADLRLRQGLAWAAAEAVFAALPYGLLWWLLHTLLQGPVPTAQTAAAALGLLACLAARIACARQAMPATFAGAYATMGQARLRLADHLRQLPLGWFGGQRSGAIAGALVSDLQVVEDIWAHFLGVFFGGLLVPLLVSALLIAVDWRLGLLVAATLPLAFAVLAFAQWVLGRLAVQVHAANAQGQAEVLDYVQGIAVVRAFGGHSGGLVFERLARALDAMRRRALAIELWPTPLIVAFGFAVEAGFALAVWAGAQRLGRSLDGATLLLFAVLALPVYRQLFEVGVAFLELRYARHALQRLRALLAEPCLPEPAQPAVPAGHEIVLDDVHFSHQPGAPVLRGISCTLPAGSVTAVVGPSGAGKSTLVHLIARLWDVERGAIRIGGQDLRAIGSEALHRQVAMVFQDVVLFSGNVLDNIRLGRPEATRLEAEAAARQAGAHDFISRLPQGYDTPVGENGARLSGGERQRISIARALLMDAPILLLDEATASVDASSAAEIQQALSALAKDRTVVVIAHRLPTVRSANQILVLDSGRLVEQGQHDELLAQSGLYARLWNCQERAARWRVQRVK
ncbi:ABC transporter ATP-binding protein [Acidovorax sacchari]|uniref:ABC transporter ATP-binding protein n=1 Tax=Acidovorax sacchari TaxID=3230736 RepID=UPI0039E59F91